MAIEGELARAGIVTLTALTVVTKDAEMSQDLRVLGDLSVDGDAQFDGDVYIGGALTGNFVSSYWLVTDIIDLTGANTYYLVVPTDGDGNITGVRWVVTSNLANPGVSDASVQVTTNVGLVPIDVDIAQAAIEGTTGLTPFPPGTANVIVAEGQDIQLDVSNTEAAGECRLLIEIERT